jgi:FkbM family methyltransferase
VDVGANVGAYALPPARRLKHLRGGHGYAFEPALAPQVGVAASREVAALSTITLVPLARGSRPGRRVLTRLEPFPDGELALPLRGRASKLGPVHVMPFDQGSSAQGIARLDVLKIDVAGGEYDVLRGMSSSIEAFRPRSLLVEVVPAHLERAGTSVGELARLLRELGYVAEGPRLDDVASARGGRLGPNVVLRPRGRECASRYRLDHGTFFVAGRSLYYWRLRNAAASRTC